VTSTAAGKPAAAYQGDERIGAVHGQLVDRGAVRLDANQCRACPTFNVGPFVSLAT